MSGAVDGTAVAAIAKLAEEGTNAEVIDLVEGRLAGVLLKGSQRIEQIDLDAYADNPARKVGHPTVGDEDSFVVYVDRHKTAEGTTLWANVERGTVIAVLNDHETDRDREGVGRAGLGLAGHGDHRVTLTLPSTPDWTHWLKADGALMGQVDFAEHIEDGAGSVRVPDAATMMEIAQTFHASNGVNFKSSSRLQSGQTQFVYEEDVRASAGVSGTLEIPEVITLGLQPFENGPTYEVVARFRYRISNGGLRLGYRLVRPDLCRRAAFADILASISTRTELPVVVGSPRPQ